MKKWCVLFVGFMSFQLLAFADDKKPETTTVDQVTFTNELFGFSVKKPNGWVAQNTTDLLALQQQGSSLMAGDDKAMKSALEKALQTSLPLFSFLSHPVGTKGQAVISVVSAAENIKAVPGSMTACDYLEHVRGLLTRSAVKVTVSDKCQALDTGNANLSFLDSKMEMNGITIQQRFHACRKNDFMLNMVETFLDEKGSQQTSEIVRSLKIKCD